MNYTQAETLAQCVSLASKVQPATSLDAAKLLWALCLNESSGGTDCGPRFEPTYYKGGRFYSIDVKQRILVGAYDKLAASSFGPLQVMFPNFPPGTTPDALDDIATVMRLSVDFLVTQLVRFKPVTLTTIGQLWNHGSPTSTPSAGVIAYTQKLCQNYDKGLPQ